ncbi:protein kinase domain-containing protein [Thalassoroseus pseudoceratinae]|uniref:protein kinase domain-containing protein n=1 Tax=Thalassoroseus pseudoceratinae TaxID=2713176 RepID=UPI001421CEC7|nr:SUMF1/EgtB/PvdO family nonheme iron enzyme [Thalassoroseus pseudoceratinae]
MPAELAREIEKLWQANSTPPDVFKFLAQQNGLGIAQQLAVLLEDQKHRWQTNFPLRVEDYLANLPDLAADPRIKLELAVGEYQARQQGDTSPSIDEFTSRFADISDTLRSRLSDVDQDVTYGTKVSLNAEKGIASTQTVASETIIDSHQIGRYRVVRLLGEGAFGRVWLAEDVELQRRVAIKEPRPERFQKPEDAEAYLTEARTVAKLDHPHIVPVYDMGRTDDGSVYVVSKFIPGQTLEDRIEQDRPAANLSAQLLATIAQALQHAHDRRLIHRDLKPANILLEEDTGTPYVTDFGLAIREDDFLAEGHIAGTPAYMSPEQARGEGHRLDGRSDIFSLGIVFYELLTGRRPFHGSSAYELMVQISSTEPRPPRELDDSVPVELERICLKSLSKRASDRYAKAAELADDLLHWQQGPEQATKSHQIVPKGLRSFDASDSDFFLELLPGPRNRVGLPESIQFWKTRIEETDPDKTFTVGLIYGPSGCGKSSMVKAGLLTRLSNDVVAVYVEATPEETETRILRGLRKQLPELSESLGLVETLTLLRRSEGPKVLIVLDQFEQWLHSHRSEQTSELVSALRHCDGGKLQAILMVRDDFSMAASRFMRALETRILEGHNFATVDLFDVDHAEKVLFKFGQAFGKLPTQTSQLTDEERNFVSQVASGLSQDGQVVCVRLALFAEMVKGKPWRISTLEEVGGTKGIGVNFLEDTFSSRNANPEHRLHQQAARNVLRSLLPKAGSDIKGHMRSHDELLEASGYKNRPADFEELLRILDGELRLITPTDPEGFQSETSSDPGSKYYQLTHDYLVPSLREWLTRKQQETKRGRAELRLEERAGLWNAKPENRHLPSWYETIRIRKLTDKKKWTEPQRKMMKKAGRFHGLRILLLMLLLFGTGYGGVSIRQSMITGNQSTRARGLVESLQKAEISQVPNIVFNLDELREWADPMLKTRIEAAEDGSPEKLHLSLALLPVDSGQIEYLTEQLPVCSLDQFPVVRDALLRHEDQLTEDLWGLVQNEEVKPAQRFQAAAALATYSAEDERWEEIVPFVTQYLTGSTSSVTFGDWLDFFQPASQYLTKSLAAIHNDRNDSQKPRETAALALARYWSDQPDELTEAILIADEIEEFSPLVEALKPHASEVEQQLRTEMNAKMSAKLDKTNDLLSDEEQKIRDAHWKRQALAAVTLVHLGFAEDVWPLLEFTPNPSLRSFIVRYLGKLGTNHNTLAARLKLEDDVSIRRALIQSLGGLDMSQIPASDRERIAEQLEELYVNHPDSGIHSSASWTLRQWGVELSELPVGEPTLSEDQKQRVIALREQIEKTKAKIKEQRWEQIAEWGKKISKEYQELPPSSDDALQLHYTFDTLPAGDDTTEQEPRLDLHGDTKPQITDGVIGNAMGLREGAYATGDLLKIDTEKPFSLAGWFLFRENEKGAGLLSNRDKDNRLQGVEIFHLGSGTIQFHLNGQTGYLVCMTEKASNEPNSWYHIVITYDGTKTVEGMRIFVNGKAQEVTPGDGIRPLKSELIESPVPLHFGTRPIGLFTFTPLDGAIDEIRVYDRVLTEAEMEQFYLNGLGKVQGDGSDEAENSLLLAMTEMGQSSVSKISIPLKEELAKLENEMLKITRRWYVNGQGQTMIVIPNSAEKGNSQIDHSFAISSHEVTVAEFRRFMPELSVDPSTTPSEDCPVVARTWYEAAAYCNWLSEQEGIPEDQWIYVPNSAGKYEDGMTIKENYETLSGYRLPSEAEWELACRAGTEAAYSFGEPVPLLRDFAWYGGTSSGHTHAVETLLPNDLGLFDVHGNVWEWSQNPTSGPMSPVHANTRRVLRGGSFYFQSSNLRSAQRNHNVPSARNVTYGFRPSRTYN